VRRTLFTAACLALVLASPGAAQVTDRSLLMPGVTYTRQVEFTPHGPVVLNVVNAPRPGGLYSLLPVLSNESIVGREKLTDMEKRVSSTATVAGINGDFFNFNDGHPSGVLMRNGLLDHAPIGGRSSIGIGADGSLHVDRIDIAGFWRGTGQRRRLALNDLTSANGASLFTPAWGVNTPGVVGVEAVLQPFPGVKPNTDLVGVVTQISSTSGSTVIPRDGAVLQARGSSAVALTADAPVGTQVTVRFTLIPSWDGIVNALGGGPIIVRDGKPVFRANEEFTPNQITPRDPRTAIGQRADGRILLVAVDGRQPGYSVGMTNFELALAMMQLGAATASALDSGGSTGVAFDGQLLNRPSDPTGERPIGDALLIAYSGVYARPATEPVLSPNGDGVAETETLAYKVVRASTVQASLVGPGNVTIPIDSGPRAPGSYSFTWNGKDAAGLTQPEGQWRFTVSATDDQAQPSTADRLFQLNDTLASLTVDPTALRLRKTGTLLTASFTLARTAKVTVTVETAKGIVIRVLARDTRNPGTQTLTWDGRDGSGRLAYRGAYQVHVSATNELGRVDLTAPFTARR
jgi:exopolysaccharide biosynthesis protein/flagellar hook assembly protein FlgD